MRSHGQGAAGAAGDAGGGVDPGQPIIEAITSWTDHATQLGVMKVCE